MGQCYAPTIFRKNADIAAIYEVANKTAEGQEYDLTKEQMSERPVAALFSHDFKVVCTGYNGQKFKSSVGSKLMEHSYIGNLLCRAMEHFLSHEYAGCPVVWSGQYGDEVFEDENGEGKSAYQLADDNLTTKTFKSLPPRREWYRYHKYLINHDTHEYVKLPKMSNKEYRIHPLPLLTANGNGLGSGDYRGINKDLVGMWCGHHLSVANELPNDEYYKELIVKFEEKN